LTSLSADWQGSCRVAGKLPQLLLRLRHTDDSKTYLHLDRNFRWNPGPDRLRNGYAPQHPGRWSAHCFIGIEPTFFSHVSARTKIGEWNIGVDEFGYSMSLQLACVEASATGSVSCAVVVCERVRELHRKRMVADRHGRSDRPVRPPAAERLRPEGKTEPAATCQL